MPGSVPAFTMYLSAVSVSKFFAPNAYDEDSRITGESPPITYVTSLAAGQRGYQPLSTASFTSDCIMSLSRSGSKSA